MADQYTPEEIADIFEAYDNAIKNNIPISAALAKQMQDAVKATRGLAQAQEEFGKSLGRSAVQLGNSLYKGEKGVGQFGDAIENAATALQTLILAIPGLGLVAKLATVAIGALAKGVNAAAKQGDSLYKSFQDLGRVGTTASDGITGVFRNMQNLGYGIEELDKMVQLVTQNSETLAKFSLTAADGTNAFAQGMAQIQRDGGLRLLGKTTDDINSAGAAYIRQSVRAGMSQKDIGDKLGAQTKAYIMELDRLQRLTGMSADALQKQQDEAMAEDAYNDVMSELKQRAAAGDEVAKMQIEKITTVMSKLGPELRKEFILSVGGDISAGSRLFMGMPNLMKNVMDETVDTQKTINDINKDAANTVGTFGKSARLAAGAFRDTMGPLYEYRETMVATQDFDARTAAAKKNAGAQDNATKAITETQIANMNSRDAMQSFIQKGVAPATVALSKLAGAASALTTTGAQAVGAPGAGGQRGIPSFDRARTMVTGENQKLLDIIGRGESGGNYNALVYGKPGANVPKTANLTGMTIAEVMEYQKNMIAQGHASTAVGKYQMIASTLAEQVKKAGLDPNTTKFDEKTQDRLAQQLINQAGYGQKDTATVMRNLAGTWASLPADLSGRGRYDGFNANKATIDPNELYSVLSKTGPSGGYAPSLTNTAAASNMPAKTDQTQDSSQQQTMTTQLVEWLGQVVDKLDNLNRVQRDQLGVQQKQLQATS